MKKKIETIINNSPFYNIMRFNFFSDFIIEKKTKKTKKAIDFYSSFLDNSSTNNLIYDVGANKGNKVKAFLKLRFKVLAIEPEKKALSTLHWRFRRNKNVIIIEKGVSDKEDMLTIHIAENRSGLNTLSDKWVNTLETENENRWHKKYSFRKSYEVEVTTLEHLFSEYGLPYFVKIDVEGYENKVIKGMRQLPSYISFETNLPEFKNETIESIEHLNSLSGNITFNYSFAEKIESEKWLTMEEIISIINDPSIRYMEILCKKN